MRADRAKTIAGAGMMIAAVLVFYISLRQAPPKVDPRPEEALGQVLAEEAAKLLGSGGRIMLIRLDTAVFKSPAVEFQLRGFHQTLQKAQLTVAATNVIKLDPLRLLRAPPADFLELIRKQSEGDVIVSFLGPPVFNNEQQLKLGDKKPRIVALCSGAMPRRVNLRELFEQGLLQAAIISRPSPGPTPPPSGNLRDFFDQWYQVVTSANLSELALLTNNLTH